jgi:uncharacterized membrane protein
MREGASNLRGVVQAASAPLSATRKPRLDSVDFLRGAVMIVMALDHTRDFFHPPGLIRST